MTRILFTHYGGDQIRGSERCLLDLIKHLDRDRFEPVVWCNADKMADEARALGIPVIRSEFPLLLGWQTPRFDLRGYWALVKEGLRITREHRIDLIHANSGAPNQWLNLVARIRKLPLLSHLHCRYPLRDRLTLGLHHTSLAVGVSYPVIDQLIIDGMPAKRVKVIPNGIDTQFQDAASRFDLRSKLGLAQGDFLAITVGSLIHRKGVDLLIDSIAQLRDRGTRVHLAIVGSGPEQAILETLVERHNIGDRVHFLGERSDVPGLLRGGPDVFVSGAREEVFGLVLAEANLASLPVIAPRVGGIPEVVQNTVNGILVAPGESPEIADALEHLLENPEKRISMGQAGRNRVLNELNIENNVSKFQHTYLQLAHDPKNRLTFLRNGSVRCLFNLLGRAARVGWNNRIRLPSADSRKAGQYLTESS